MAQLAKVLIIFLNIIYATEETVQQQMATQARILQALAATIPEMAVGEDKKPQRSFREHKSNTPHNRYASASILI